MGTGTAVLRIGTENGYIAYHVGISYSGRLRCTCDAIPVDLLAAERMEIYMAKSVGSHITGHFRENIFAKWQRRWNDEDRRSWTATYGHVLVRNFERIFTALHRCYRVTDILGNICTEWARPLLSLRGRGSITAYWKMGLSGELRGEHYKTGEEGSWGCKKCRHDGIDGLWILYCGKERKYL